MGGDRESPELSEEDRGGSGRIETETDGPRGRVRVGVNPYPLGWWVGEVAALNAWPKGRRINQGGKKD